MQKEKNIKVGIGFATGRKSFQKVLRTNIYNWKESGLVENKRISLNLFVAYDLSYYKTKNKINIKTVDGTAILDPDQIFFIEKEGKHSIIHSQQGRFDTLLSIIDLEAILPQQFIKTHSAYIVNISKILTIKPTNSRNYKICFSGYEKTAWISRGGFKKYKALFASDL